MSRWGKTHYLPRGSRIATTASWAHSPNIVWEKLRSLTMPSLNYTIAGTLILHSTIFRLRQREGSGFSENLPKRHDSTSTLSEWLVPTL